MSSLNDIFQSMKAKAGLLDAAPAAPRYPFELSPDQQSAFNIAVSGQGHMLLTGDAGTGKSTVIGRVRDTMPVGLCATTARAALQIGGCTIDSMFCFKRKDYTIRSHRRLQDIMSKVPRTIIIDEASMIGAQMANLIFKLAADFKKRLILVGDWAQASPVKDDWAVDTELIRGATHAILRQCHRQSDPTYLAALNEIRHGFVGQTANQVFAQCITATPPDDDRYLRMYATNAATDQYNLQRLSAMDPSLVSVTPRVSVIDQRPQFLQQQYPMGPDEIKNIAESVRFADGEPFKVGARIIMTFNDIFGGGRWVNGDVGNITEIWLHGERRLSEMKSDVWAPVRVEDHDIQAFEIQLDRCEGPIYVDRCELGQDTPDKLPSWTISGFPLRLGWALTIHKSQGMTLDHAYVDMGSIGRMKGESSHGLAYVAFSRTRTLEGLRIGNWLPEVVMCSDKVKPLL